MSSFRKTNNAKNERKPFCKVCQDAGKSESEYTSHYVRTIPDHNGNTTVICPTLLSTECRYCCKLGHTTKFCPVIANNKKNEERRNTLESKPVVEKKVIPKVIPKLIYNFALLAADSDSDEENTGKPNKKVRRPIKKDTVAVAVPIEKADYPLLPNSISSVVHTEKKIMTGWAAIVAKTPVKPEEIYIQELIANSIKQRIPKIKKVVVVVMPPAKKNQRWADDTDTEESDLETEDR
jgi:hypothetical protein